MADGKYDLDGKCVVCGKYHPCDCEIENVEPEQPVKPWDMEEEHKEFYGDESQ